MQLKAYILEHSYFPQMDSSYIPVAANSTTMASLLGISHYTPTSLSADKILFFCPIAATVSALIIITILLILYGHGCGGICKLKNNTKTTLKKQDKATTVALSVVSFVRILIFIGLDSAAVYFMYSCSDPRVEALCKFSNLIHNTPTALLVCDIGALVAFFIIVVIPIILYCIKKLPSPAPHKLGQLNPSSAGSAADSQSKAKLLPKTDQDQNQSDQIDELQYYCCALSVICFIFSCLIHTPYVAMAYLSDAHYATSILIYYMTILFIEFGVIQYTITFYFDPESFIYKNKWLTILLIVSLILLLYCLVLSVSFFYYYIPMINVVTNLPNEGVVVYQTAIVLVGAYITYKTLIKAENSEQSINDNHHTNLKEAEIALLECEIDYETDQAKLKTLKKKRLRLRKEILLGCIQHTLKSESENKEICNYLNGEIDHLTRESQTDDNSLIQSQIAMIQKDLQSILKPNDQQTNHCKNPCAHGFSLCSQICTCKRKAQRSSNTMQMKKLAQKGGENPPNA